MIIVILSIVGLTGHMILAGNRLMDLFTKSKRSNKIQWMMFILIVPVIGAWVYNFTMRRPKVSRRTMFF